MASSNQFANVASCVLLTLAIICGVYCLLVCGFIFSESDGVGFAIIDYMVTAEGPEPDPSASPFYYLRWVVGLSLIGAFFSIFGCIGSCECMPKEARQPLLSTFLCSMLALAVFFMVIYTSTVEFGEDMIPILVRQTSMMTDASVLPVFSARLGCPSTPGPTYLAGQISAAELAAVPCGEDCEQRLDLIRTMANRSEDGPDSCAFLHILNRNYFYSYVGLGKCQVSPPAVLPAESTPVLPPMYTLGTDSLNECKDACTAWTACSAVSFNTNSNTCFLTSSSDPDGIGELYAPDPTAGVDTQIITPIMSADGEPSFDCHKKTYPITIQNMIDRNYVLSWLMLVGAILTLGSGLFAAIIAFTVATKMQGKKGIHMVCARMYCGCCFPASDKERVANKSYVPYVHVPGTYDETDRLTERMNWDNYAHVNYASEPAHVASDNGGGTTESYGGYEE